MVFQLLFGPQPVAEPWALVYELVIRVQMRPQPLSDLGGVVIPNRADVHSRKCWVGAGRRGTVLKSSQGMFVYQVKSPTGVCEVWTEYSFIG